MSLRLWFIALSHTALGQFMQNSKWGFAIVETFHLIALAVLGGCILLLDLRLLGFVLKDESAVALSRGLHRLFLGSLIVMVFSGIAMVSEEALKCFASPAFRWKMALLAVAVGFYFTVHRRALKSVAKGTATLQSRTAAAVSLILWLGVGVAGRAIGLI